MGLRDTKSRSNTEQGDKPDCQRNRGLFRDPVYLLPLYLESYSTNAQTGRPHCEAAKVLDGGTKIKRKGLHEPQDPTPPRDPDLSPLEATSLNYMGVMLQFKEKQTQSK